MGVILSTPIASAPFVLRQLHARLFPLPGSFGYVAGGCIRDALAGIAYKDVDIFFANEIDFRGALGAVMPALCRFVDNAVGVTLPGVGDVDICRAAFLPATTQIERFDFTCCAAAFTETLYVRHEHFEEDVRDRVLIVNHPPNATTRRGDRLAAKGWAFPDTERAKCEGKTPDQYPTNTTTLLPPLKPPLPPSYRAPNR